MGELIQRLRALRKIAGLSQREVAQLLRMRQATISEIESGKRQATLDEFLKMLSLYSRYPYSMQIVKKTVMDIFEVVTVSEYTKVE